MYEKVLLSKGLFLREEVIKRAAETSQYNTCCCRHNLVDEGEKVVDEVE